jgi:hypothetical protein
VERSGLGGRMEEGEEAIESVSEEYNEKCKEPHISPTYVVQTCRIEEDYVLKNVSISISALSLYIFILLACLGQLQARSFVILSYL